MANKKEPSKLLQSLIARLDDTNPSDIKTNADTTASDASMNQSTPKPKVKTSNNWHIPVDLPESKLDADEGKDQEYQKTTKAEEELTKKDVKDKVSKRVESLNKIGQTLSKHSTIMGFSNQSTYISAKKSLDEFSKTMESKGGESLVGASQSQLDILNRLETLLLNFVKSGGKDSEKFNKQLKKLQGNINIAEGPQKTKEFLTKVSRDIQGKNESNEKGLLQAVIEKFFGEAPKTNRMSERFVEGSVLGNYFKSKESKQLKAQGLDLDIVEGELEEQTKELKESRVSPKSKKKKGGRDKYSLNENAEELYDKQRDEKYAKEHESLKESPKDKEMRHYEESQKESRVSPKSKENKIDSMKVEKLEVKGFADNLGKILVELELIREKIGENGESTGSSIPSIDGIGNKLKSGVSSMGRIGARLLGTTAGAAATSVALGAGADYVAGQFGVGKDENGNDLKVDERQDDENWNKMSFLEKAQSGVARGIEKVGNVAFLGNMSKQAQADRIKKETEYLSKGEITPKSNSLLNNSADVINQKNEAINNKEQQPIIINNQAPPQVAPQQNNSQVVPVKADPNNNDGSFKEWAKHKLQGW